MEHLQYVQVNYRGGGEARGRPICHLLHLWDIRSIIETPAQNGTGRKTKNYMEGITRT